MIICQKCSVVNFISEEACRRCGATLMVLTQPSRQEGSLPVFEEHLLERISALENVTGRLEERLGTMAEMVQQLTTESFYDHSLSKSLVESLDRAGIVCRQDLEKDWRRRAKQDLEQSEERNHLELSKLTFLSAFRGKNKDDFSKLVDKSNQFFLERKYWRGLKALERAFLADPQNCEVGLFLGKTYFEFREYGEAGKCLKRVLKSDPNHFEANLLVGLLAKRRGDLSKARRYLSNAVNICHSSLTAHVILGSVLVSLGEASEALGHFCRALYLKPSSKIYLLVGTLYSLQGRKQYAIQHIKKAIEMDPRCDQAFFQLGLAFLKRNWKRKAKKCFQQAHQLNPEESRYSDAASLAQKPDNCKGALAKLQVVAVLNDEAVEIFLQEELQLNFQRGNSSSSLNQQELENSRRQV